jgi:hypothetical protein
MALAIARFVARDQLFVRRVDGTESPLELALELALARDADETASVSVTG